MDTINKAVETKKKFDQLIKIVKTGNMCNTGEFIDSLDEETAKDIIRKLVYGGWKNLNEPQKTEKNNPCIFPLEEKDHSRYAFIFKPWGEGEVVEALRDKVDALFGSHYSEEQLQKGVMTTKENVRNIIGNTVNDFPNCPCCGRLTIPALAKNYREIDGVVSSRKDCPQCMNVNDIAFFELLGATNKDPVIEKYY